MRLRTLLRSRCEELRLKRVYNALSVYAVAGALTNRAIKLYLRAKREKKRVAD